MLRRLLGKCLRIAAITAGLSLMPAAAAFAAEARINFSDPEAAAGSEVNVSMKITADDGTALGDATVVLTYPSEKLEFVSGTDSDGGAGAIRVHGASIGSGTSVLEYNLKFNTLSAGNAVVGVDSYEVYDTSDQVVTINHVGNSSINITAAGEASSDCSLGTLDVYPGELSPAFSGDTSDYSVTVGLGVDRLTINAIPTDSSSSVSIEGNESLPEGDSSVVITVNASDGTTSRTYTINVSKVEGGPENVISETVPETAEGVQLSSKGKTITIINPDEDVEIPEGFRQGTIRIDDQKVQGWVWGADENPEYCVVYGMNDSGELNFYRYDMVEKTIQRYFADPLAAGAVSGAEYEALEAVRDAAEESANLRFVIICVLAAVIFVLLMIVIYLTSRLKAYSRSRSYRPGNMSDRRPDTSQSSKEPGGVVQPAAEKDGTSDSRKQSTVTGTVAREESIEDAGELLKHDFEAESNTELSQKPADETMLIRRTRRKRRPRHVSSENTQDASGQSADSQEISSGDDGTNEIEDFDI